MTFEYEANVWVAAWSGIRQQLKMTKQGKVLFTSQIHKYKNTYTFFVFEYIYSSTKINTQFLYLSIYTQVQKFTNTPDRVSGINVYSWQSKKRICWLLKCINTITHIYAYTNTQLHTRKYKYTNTLQVSNSKLRDSLISVIGAASPNTLSRPNPRRRESKPLVAPLVLSV